MKSMWIHSAIAALTLFAMSLPNIALAQSAYTAAFHHEEEE